MKNVAGEDMRGRKSSNNVLRDDNAVILKNADDIRSPIMNDESIDGSGGDFISLTQAMEKSEKVSYGFAASSKNVTSQSERSQPICSSPQKKNATSALDRLLCTNSRRREGNNNSRLNMETKSLVSDEVVVEQEQQRRKVGALGDLNEYNRNIESIEPPLELVKVPSTTLAREFGPDSKEKKKKKEEEKKVGLRVSFPAPSLSWGNAEEQVFAHDNIRTTKKERRSIANNEKKRKATSNGAPSFTVEEDHTSKKSPSKEFMVEWDDDEDDEIIENHHIYLNTDSAVAVEKATLENHATNASRVASALKMDPSDMNVQEKMMKKL